MWSGSNASVELSWHVGFTPESGRALGGNERRFGPTAEMPLNYN